jgi:murein DD-endopeptidase MepM/ murein hydrolase activator NlpD
MFERIMQGGGVLTQDFGQTSYALGCRCEWTCPGYSPGAFHAGIDIAPPTGGNPTLYAVGYGQCVRVGRVLQGYTCSGLGPYAPCIRSGSVDVWYGHALRSLVSPGQFVVPGQPIAVCDSIGCSTGNHVHYEVLPAGQDPNGCNAINPWAYVSAWPGGPGGANPCPPGTVGPGIPSCSCAPGWVPRNDGSGLCMPAPAPAAASSSTALLLAAAGAGLLLLAAGSKSSS